MENQLGKGLPDIQIISQHEMNKSMRSSELTHRNTYKIIERIVGMDLVGDEGPSDIPLPASKHDCHTVSITCYATSKLSELHNDFGHLDELQIKRHRMCNVGSIDGKGSGRK
jgi:hypothetical protein